MLDPEKPNLYFYRVTKLGDARDALVELVKYRNAQSDATKCKLETSFTYLDGLLETLNSTASDPFTKARQEMIRMMSLPYYDRFLKNPNDDTMYAAVVEELVNLAAATGNLGGATEDLYDKEEIEMVLQGTLPYYDEVTFIRSLYGIFDGSEHNVYGPLFFRALPNPAKDFAFASTFLWGDALIVSLMFHIVWQSFAFLTPDNQTFLLQNYLYSSIAAGVPVRDWIAEFFQTNAADVDYKAYNDILAKAVDYNSELVIINFLEMSTRPLTQVVRDFMSAVYSEPIATIPQEKMLAELYDDDSFGEFLSEWLRQTLTLVLQFKKGVFVGKDSSPFEMLTK